MILVKVDSLSTQELRNIAEEEGVVGFDALDRDGLVAALREYFEEDEEQARDSSVNRRFLYGLTDYREIDKDIQKLPGVVDLPESYPNTEIHLLYKNPYWAYAYWAISKSDRKKLEESGCGLFLTIRIENNDEKSVFSIPISIEDTEWNVSLSSKKGTCTVSLTTEQDGKSLELAHSSTLNLIDSYYLDNPEEIYKNDNLFKIYLSQIANKDGEVEETPLIDEILSVYEKGVTERWKA